MPVCLLLCALILCWFSAAAPFAVGFMTISRPVLHRPTGTRLTLSDSTKYWQACFLPGLYFSDSSGSAGDCVAVVGFWRVLIPTSFDVQSSAF